MQRKVRSGLRFLRRRAGGGTHRFLRDAGALGHAGLHGSDHHGSRSLRGRQFHRALRGCAHAGTLHCLFPGRHYLRTREIRRHQGSADAKGQRSDKISGFLLDICWTEDLYNGPVMQNLCRKMIGSIDGQQAAELMEDMAEKGQGEFMGDLMQRKVRSGLQEENKPKQSDDVDKHRVNEVDLDNSMIMQ